MKITHQEIISLLDKPKKEKQKSLHFYRGSIGDHVGWRQLHLLLEVNLIHLLVNFVFYFRLQGLDAHSQA
jgi:hypothetical protein